MPGALGFENFKKLVGVLGIINGLWSIACNL